MSLEWKPIEEAKCVGKKRYLFALDNGGFVSGYRMPRTRCIRDDFGIDRWRAKAFMELPDVP